MKRGRVVSLVTEVGRPVEGRVARLVREGGEARRDPHFPAVSKRGREYLQEAKPNLHRERGK